MKIHYTPGDDQWQHRMALHFFANIHAAAADFDEDYEIEVLPYSINTDPNPAAILPNGLFVQDLNTSFGYSEEHWLEDHNGTIYYYISEAGSSPVAYWHEASKRFVTLHTTPEGSSSLLDPYAL